MFNQKTYQAFSVGMAIWLLVVSVGFTASEHYCQGDLKSSTWFGEARSCHDMDAAALCQDSVAKKPCKKGFCKSEKSTDKPCCENETVFFQMDVDYSHFQISAPNDLNKQSAIFAYTTSENLLFNIHSDKSNFNLYKPPNHSTAHRVLTQSFLL